MFLGATKILLHVALIHSLLISFGVKNSEWKYLLAYSGLVFLVWSEFPWGIEQVKVEVKKVAQTDDTVFFLPVRSNILGLCREKAAETNFSLCPVLSDRRICSVIAAVRKSFEGGCP